MKIFFNRIFLCTLVSIYLHKQILAINMVTNTPDEIPIKSEDPPQNEEEIIKCNEEILIQYGLMGGQGVPTNKNQKYCPTINQNCCTNGDAERSMEVWENEIKPIVER